VKSKKKIKIIILISFGIIFVLSTIITSDFKFTVEHNDKYSLESLNLKFSKVSGKIHIVGDSGWADAEIAGICKGNGTYTNPYLIEDLEIDAGGVGSCIWIENSVNYFMILNCSLTNTEDSLTEAEITLYNVSNGYIINNTLYNSYLGFYLYISNSITIIGNSINMPHTFGINIVNCDNILAYLNNIRGSSWDLFFQDSTYRFYSEEEINYTYNDKGFTSYLGNYWRGYWYSDNNNDGIGDTPHIFYDGTPTYVDYYPLITPTENYELNGGASEEIPNGGAIPGYNLFLLLGILSIVSILIIKRIKNKS